MSRLRATTPRLRLLTRAEGPGKGAETRGRRRGVYLLPSLFTMGNLFCGYACVVHALRGEFVPGAIFIGIAIVLDMLDGRVARLTGTSTAFGVEFDSLADVVSFGVAPAILSFAWGLSPLGRLGWAAGFVFVAGAAVRLARFNIQSGSQDKRYFAGMPSPAAAAIPAATVFAFPEGLHAINPALGVLAMVLVPGLLMVSTIRFRSFKSLDLGARRTYPVLIVVAVAIALLVAHPEIVLMVLAYGYLVSPIIGLVVQRLRRGKGPDASAATPA